MKRFLIALIVIIALFAVSCEIGLGSAVDTDPPSMKIDNPSVDTVIRDAFAIDGSWTDDGEIDSIVVKLERTDIENPPDYNVAATVNKIKLGQGTWSATIDPVGKGIPDGAYQATVTIKDATGRETIKTRTFTIDNTPPLIVLTRPSAAAGAKDADSYGQKFTIEGQAADTNNISRIEIYLYSDEACTQQVGSEPIVLKNVPLSISLDAANYNAGDQAYIYKNENEQNFSINVPLDAGAKKFYSKIYAYDGAERIPAPGAEAKTDDSKGNRAEFFYLYKDIYTPILQYYKITELYQILEGNYKDESARSVSVTAVKSDLLSETKYRRSIGYFSLNPKNNPVYKVTGRSPGVFDDIVNGQNLFIEVSPGLDDIPLDEDSLKVYVQKCNADGTIIGEKFYIDESDIEKEAMGTSYRFNVRLNRAEGDADGLEILSYYIIGLEGHDQSDAKTKVEPDGGDPFGFHLVAGGNAPTLEIKTPDDATTYIKKGSSQEFIGSVNVEMGVPKIMIYRDTDEAENLIHTIDNLQESDAVRAGSSLRYDFTFTYDEFGDNNEKHKFIFKADLGGSLSQAIEKTIVYDVDSPIISITKPSTAKKFKDNYGTEETGAYLNGSVDFVVMLNDKGGSGLATEDEVVEEGQTTKYYKPKYEIINAANQAVIAEGAITDTSGQTITIDTTDTKFENKTIIFRVTAYDAAGNIKTTEDRDAEFTYVIDQSTDAPYICEDTDYGKISFELDSLAKYIAQPAESKFGTVKKGATLKFFVYEDDGTVDITILKRKLTITGTNTSDWTEDLSQFDVDEAFTEEKDTPNKLVSMNSYSFPSTDAECVYYEYVIIAKDKSDKSASPRQTQKGPFIVRITKDEASVSVEKDFDYRKKDLEFTNTITIIPSEGPYKLYRQVVKAGQEYKDKAFGNDTDITQYLLIKDNVQDTNLVHEDKIKIGDYNDDKDITVYYKVIDGSNQQSAPQSVILKVDNDTIKPEIKAPVEGNTGKKALTESLISAVLKDDKSGVAKVFYKFTNATDPAVSDLDYKEEEARDGSFTLDPEFVSGLARGNNQLCEGKWTFHIYTEDAAGNASEVATREFDIDMADPVITTTLDDTALTVIATQNRSSAYTLKFKITETNKLHKTEPVTITVKKGSTVLAANAYKIKDGSTPVELSQIEAGKDYTIEIPNQEIPNQGDGLYTYTIKVKDFVGKEASVERKVQFDTTPPVATHKIDSSLKDLYFRIGDYANAAGDEDVGGKYQNGTYGNALTIQIRGYFADAESGSGIKKFYYKTFNNQEVVVDGSKDYSGATDDKPYLEGTGNEAGKIFFKNADILKNFVMSKNTGTFYPSDSVEEKTVEYNIGPFGTDEAPVTSVAESEVTDPYHGTPTTPIADGKYTVNENHYVQFKKSVPSNYKETISGFEEGKNFLVLVAEDNVGNTTIDFAVVEGVGTFYCYSLNVDITSPSIPTKEEETRFTNIEPTNNDPNVHFYIEGTVSDYSPNINGSSGIKSIIFTRDGESEEEIELSAGDLTPPTEADLHDVPAKYRTDATLRHWKVDVKKLLPTIGTAIISAKVKDNVGKEISVPVASISIDNTPPTLKFDSTGGYHKDSVIYIKDSITAIVSATDKNGIAESTQITGGKIYYNIKSDSSNLWSSDKSIDISKDTGVGTISIPKSEISFVNGKTYTLVISAEDTVGNKKTEVKEFTVDATKPDQTELKLDTKTEANLLAETKPWFSKETLKLTGKFTDSASGVKTIYYKRWLSTGTEPTTAVELSPTFVNEDGGYYMYETNIGGFEKGLNKLKVWAQDNVGNYTTAVPYDVQLDVDAPEIYEKNANDFDTEYKTNGVTPKQFEFNVKEVHSGISANNFIVKVGSGTDPLTLGSGELWTDTDETQLLALKAKDTLTTGEQTTKNALEAKSALNLVKIGTKTGDNYSVTVQIGSTAVSGLNGNKSVTVTVQDIAGNKSTTTPIGSLNVDTTEPVVNFSKPAENAKLNKEYKITGSITEKNEIKSIILTATTGTGASAKTNTYFYKKTLGEGETNSITLNEDKSWEITVNTNTAEWNDSTASEDWTLTVSVVDEAGNVSDDSTRSVKVDQNSDRPIIKVSQIPVANGTDYGYVTSKQLYGSIEDDDKTDDKTVNKLWLWQKQTGKNNNQAPSSAPSYNDTSWTTPTGWIEIDPDNNSWDYDSDEAEGLTTWYWAVADINNNVFWTGADSQLERPYIIYKGEKEIGENADNTTGLSFKYDTKAPEITDIGFLRLATTETNATTGNAYTADEIKTYLTNYNQNKPEAEKLRWISEDNYVFGKNKALMYIKVSVNETNEMAVWDSSTQIGPMALSGFNNTLTIDERHYSEPVRDGNTYEYYIGPINLSSYTLAPDSENYPVVTLNFNALDKAGKSAEKTKPIKIDNRASFTIENVTPNPETEMSGDFEFLSTKMKDAESKIASIKYYIPKSSETSAENINSSKWEPVTDFSDITFNIDFIDFGPDKLAYKTYKENGVSTVNVGPDYRAYDIGFENEGTKAQGVYRVPIWFKLEDEVGNVGYVTNHKIKYNPNTDRPKVTLEEPKHSDNESFVELGGSIRISGTATDNDDISGVYLQFAIGDAEFGNTKPKVNDSEDNEIDLPVGNYVTIPGTDNADKGVKANNTLSWNYSFNVGNLKNGTLIRVRAKAVDSDVKNDLLSSAWSDEITIKVNNDRPIFGSLYLKKYDGTTEKASQLLQSNTFINGEWYLEGSVETNSSEYLKSLSIGDYTWNGNAEHNGGSWTGSNALSGATVQYVTHKKISFKIPVRYDSNDTEWTREIKAVDNNNDSNKNTSTISPVIKIDTQSPSFPDIENGKIKLYQDSYGVAGKPLGDTYVLQNSNGSNFTLAGKVEEEGSGFNKLVFYFKRIGNDNKPRVYNPMLSRTNDANRSYISDSSTTTTEKPIYMENDLPVRKITVTRPTGTTDKLQASEIATNGNIRVGGLVKIGGSYRTITGITDDIATFNPAEETGDTTALFVYGLVVDSQNERALNNGRIDEKDKDGIRENYSGNQDNGYDWNVTFNSAAIPDGPIQIHIVAFDNAGNIGHGYMETRASNNAPRITSVMLGTDLNGNGKFDYGSGEFTTFYAQKDSNQNPIKTSGKELWDLHTSEHMAGEKNWKVKNGLAVIPEFVGGRSDFYYQFSTHDTEGLDTAVKLPYSKEDEESDINTVLTTWKLKKAGQNSDIVLTGTSNAATWNYTGENDGGSLTLTSNQIKAAKAEEGATTTDGVKWYRFSFWDSTEDSDPGLNTGSAILNIQLEQDLEDGISPDAYIEPFKWEGTGYTKSVSTTVGSGNPTVTASVLDELTADDVLGTSTKATTTAGVTTVEKTTITPKNSLYGASKANGHIELQEDIKNISAITSALGSDDPKVSGKITFNGTLFDETRLSSIWFKFEDLSVTGFTQTTTNGGTKYDVPATGMKDTNGNTDYTQAAWYNKSSATWELASTDISTNNWSISVTDQSFDQDGHTAEWYLSIDTSQIDGVAGKDKALTIVALDAAGQMSTIYTSGSEDQTIVNGDGTQHKTSYYKVDVVPYITGIETSLDEAYASDPSAFNRSALGVYPVLRGEEGIVIKGFNFATSATVSKGTKTSSDSGSVTISIPDNATSGELSVTVNSVTSLNNLNSVEVEYNQEPNSSNNRILNNRRKFYVWENSHKTVNATLDSTIRYPTFRVGPNGEEVFSFDLGGDSAYLYKDGQAVKVGGSYTQWYDTAVSIDNNGNLYGVAINGDNKDRGSVEYGDNARFHFYPLVGNNTTYVDTYTTSALAPAWENDSNGTVYNPNRVQNPKLVTTSENGVNKIYSTYYDISEKLVKFRAGTIQLSQNTTATFTRYNNGKPSNGYYLYSSSGTGLGGKYIEINGSYRLIKRYNNTYYTIAGCTGENIAGTKTVYDITLSNSISNYADDSETGSAPDYQTIASGSSASPYSALAVASNGTAVVCWYDSVAKSLKLTYNTTPLTGTTWEPAITVDSGLAGWYPDMVIDKDGGIHIAYYGAKNGDLKYAYLTSYTDNKADVCTVDSFLSVGTRASIAVSTNKQSFKVGETTVEKYVPFISYYMGAFTASQTSVRTAWPVELGLNEHSAGTNTYIDGVNADMFTGSWEVQTLPLDSFPTDYTIGIGVKNTSTTEAAAAIAEGNIILGYGTMEGLETARLY